MREKDKNWTYNNYNNRKDHNQSSLYFPNNLPTRSCLRRGSLSDFALNTFMWEGNCWNLTAQEITQRFPTLLHVVHQQLLWWNKRLNAVIVLAVSLTQDKSWLGVCRAKKSVYNRIYNKEPFSWSRRENTQKPARYHCLDDLNLIDRTLQPRIFFSFA